MTREVSRLCVTGTSAVTDTEKGRRVGRFHQRKGSQDTFSVRQEPFLFPVSRQRQSHLTEFILIFE